MSLLTVEATNFLIFKKIKVDLNKESILVIGDSGKGKTTFSRIIRCHMGIEEYPANPLPDDEDSGSTKTTHQAPDGRVFEVSRKYVREEDGSVKLDRFEVRGPAGKEKSLKYVMDTVFQGAFTGGRFDYSTYFNKTKGQVERYKYFVDAIGGVAIDENLNKIEEAEIYRAPIGRAKDTQKALFDQAGIPADHKEAEEKLAYFQKKLTVEDAATAKAELLLTKKPTEEHQATYEKHVNAVELSETYKQNIISLDAQILKLQEEKAEQEKLQKANKKDIKPEKELIAILKDAEKIQTDNKIIDTQAEELYQTKITEIVDFNSAKTTFYNGLKAFQEWQRLEGEWKKLDQDIKDLKTENEETLKKLLPLPELSIGERNKKPIVLYKGREFSDEYLSTGEQIQITAAIQMALNPKGDNFIIIPNAQDLGSKLKEVQKACKKFNVQYLVEMTKEDEEFRVEVIDSDKEVIT